jgi:hypothetical protein
VPASRACRSPTSPYRLALISGLGLSTIQSVRFRDSLVFDLQTIANEAVRPTPSLC